MLREMLRDAGYTVLEAGNGAEALAIAAEQSGPIDLLLTDVVMPGARGPELASRVLEIHPKAKVLYASGYTDGAAMAQHVGLTVGTYLQKPFTIETLLRQVRTVLDGPGASSTPGR
jgi:DNA-binding NtrC family response regulator